jgi:3-oxoacyl-[acyl-carrier protein] reductase
MNGPRTLITGGGRGIGRAIALRFARAGASVALLARTRSELESVADEVQRAGGRALALTLDLTDSAAIAPCIDEALAWHGGALDLLVNNAGVFEPRPVDELDDSSWSRTLAVNLTAPWLVTRRCLPALRAGERPQVTMINSTAGLEPYEGSAAYCASKYGLRGLADVLRLELAADGVRVASVYPRGTDTTIFDGLPGDWDRASMDRPEDVAEVVWDAWSAPDAAPRNDVEVGPVVDARDASD